ncbi:response regulator [Robbsia sp. Bb-Pol-6]|uniref:histidine kinase n=1 Tax=Robbsia betulipollinis TaxID=2981849 RepID=A0ABT3ZRL7_9BURK|nr:response regulator [Robbsia betulipollinis]MCY0389204.1 response regulator [Robbsia betulipollinis]
MPQTRRNRLSILHIAIVALIVAIFVADAFTPRNVALWILYLIPVALCLFVDRPVLPLAAAAVNCVLIAVGFILSPGMGNAYSVLNRGMGGLTMWAIAIAAFLYIASRNKLRRHAWLQKGLTETAEATRGALSAAEVATAVLRKIVGYSGAKVGVLYVLDNGQLQRLAAWALADTGTPATVAPGTGLTGQVLIERKPIIAHDLPSDYLRINSTLGDGQATHVVAAPLTADGDVSGIVELGFSGNVRQADNAVELLTAGAENIGMAVRAALYRGRLELLLEETQHQAEELQVQQEELRVSNEELEERGRALMDSQARLETQQAELEQTNVQLEEHAQRLEGQKQDLLNAQHDLTENTRALERANQYKSEFLANMSHELRTPLNSSLILSKLLQDNKHGNLSAEQVRYASTIYSSNTDLLSLINDILDLAKVEAGHMEVEAEPITIDSVVQSLLQTFEPVATEKKLGLRVERAPDAPKSIVTDHQRLLQIMKNLLSNAFKFTAQGEVVLHILAAPPAHLRFAVQDTGIGIATQNLSAIFDAFRQADGTTSRKYGGSGLGLSISREFASLLGGDIEVTSELEQGSTFTLTLPIEYTPDAKAPTGTAQQTPASARAAAPVSRPVKPLSPGRTGPSLEPHFTRPARPGVPGLPGASRDSARAFAAPSGAGTDDGADATPTGPVPRTGVADDRDKLTRPGRLILVIEDDMAFAQILYELAHELDFDCVHAATGADGTRLAQLLQPSGILLDVGLPDDSGLTVLERLKRDPRTRHLPIHMISANNHEEAALHLGAIGYSLKPTARDELVTAIERLEARLSQRVRRILIVEDDPTLRDNIQLLLAANGIEIDGVGTIADALARLAEISFDCVVMDLTLPDGSGYDLLKDMAESGPHTYPPVIVYTGRSLTSEEERRLRYYSKSIIIKGAKSPERLLDEVTLFLHSVESDLPPDQQRMLRQARQRDSAFEGRKILLAEDDVRNIFALSHVIEPLGAKLEIARNGREALEILARDPEIELVLMDVMMPEMDGLTAMQEIRKRPGMDRLPIIALTAKAMSSDRQRCLDAGANDYISKPIEVDKLLSLCRVWLAH